MAAIPVIRGKDNLLKNFKSMKLSVWKLYNASDTKSPIKICYSTKLNDSIAELEEILEILDPTGVYTLDSFTPLPNNDKNYIRPDTSITFSPSEIQTNQREQPVVNGTNVNYTPTFADHITLIQTNATLKAELDYTRTLYANSLEENKRLENELKVAEDMLDKYEEEEEENEENKGLMGMPKNIESALAKVIEEHGGVIVEGLFSKKTKLEDKLIDESEHQTMNGIDDSKLPPVQKIVEILMNHDPHLHRHLYKLALIAQQKPTTFKAFINKLENFV